jgi:hypothetical protein
VLRVTLSASGEPEGTPTIVYALKSERAAGVAADGALLLERDTRPRSRAAIVTLEWIRELRRIVGPPPVALPR